MPDLVEIGQSEHGLRPHQVLGQAPIAHLGEAPQLLDHPEGVFTTGPGARARPIDPPPALTQRPLGGRPAIYPVAYPPRFKKLPVVFFPVGLIAKQLTLLPVQQFRQLRDIGGRRIGRSNGVDDAALIGADVQLHAEVPVLALAGLLHLGVTRRSGVFGRTGRRDDGRIDNGPGPQQQTTRFEQAANLIKDGSGQTVLLGYYTVQVFPGAVTALSFRGRRPWQK